MKNTNLLYLFVILFFPCFLGYAQQTEVIVCSTIHGAHKVNTNYSYENLFDFIDNYDPDIIGVEIRAEDKDSTVTYLKNNYPYEMIEVIHRYKVKTVLGFDWLGYDLEGRSIPDNYWENINSIKIAERQLERDSLMSQKLAVLDIVAEEKNNFALNASLNELNDGRYDLINSIYYKQLTELLKHTEYSIITNFYLERDIHIASNITSIIKNNPGKKILFLMGGDHRSYTIETIRKEFGDNIILTTPK